MPITVHLFATLAETAGTREVEINDLPDPATVGALGDLVVARYPALAGIRDSIIYAVNAEYVPPDHPVRAGDDVALIPPVSGGGGGAVEPGIDEFLITPDPLDLSAIHARVLDPGAGAVSHFVGVVRDNNLGRDVSYLEYEAYPAMAEKMMERIATEVRERWTISAVVMHHRTGRLEIGEASVIIAVSAPHRGDGIEACHYAIDRLKQIVPVWKKEVWTDGEHWVEGSLTPQDEAVRAARIVSAPVERG